MNDNYEWVNYYNGVDIDSMRYNCYAYAINRVEPSNYYTLFYDRNWGVRSQYQPGNMTRNEYPLTVDADVEAYLNGTLVFYNPNDNLETE